MAGWFEDVFLTTMGVYTTTTTTTTTNRIVQRRLLRFYHRQQLLIVVAVLIIIVLLLALVVVSGQDTGKTNDHSGNSDSDGDNNNILQWQRCSVFIAPSLPMTTDNDTNNTKFNFNWGVYANRKFSKGDIVDISPLTLPVPDGSNTIERSVLNDYVYGYWRVVFQPPNAKANTNTKNNKNNKRRPSIDKLYSVLFGPDMFYNHHPTTPNVEFTTFGREPDLSSSSISLKNAMNIQGFVALRTIERGEELFTSYNGKEDGGAAWFQRRGLKMVTPPESKSKSLSTFFDLYSNQYCSKIYAGVGRPSWEDRLLPILPPKQNYNLPFSIEDIQLPKFDAGLWDAKTKINNIKQGDRLEISTALVLSLEFTRKTSLMPLVYTWQDLHQEHRSALQRLAHPDDNNNDHNELRLQYQGPDTNWMPMNNFTTRTTGTGAGAIPNYDDLVLFPVAVGVTIELIAMEDIRMAGTDLIVDVYESVATPFEYQLLYRELKLTGQPYNKQIFQHRRRQKQQQQQQQHQQQRNNKRTSTSPSTSSSSSTTIPAKEEL
ncbi:hypothetical protein FRACYDRAFT_245320 [Fragilariopsis cylindrus CCMP1102]|uniref:SET domain-containing protein n=1 Tax=Fragilariopsis cylindrus CCMP1102 TaxID=635003 RepID=A0A1E7F090_9STRA|nr:hypothetical protein FRACYDRAFT_245320 [Fragilariopsis cylindrus CCMP1102]|eukprot:OEU11474.1 hypothetical protein FRACYDRAFT_245320 [Fragilariopsis cylindrus CCMP1102]